MELLSSDNNFNRVSQLYKDSFTPDVRIRIKLVKRRLRTNKYKLYLIMGHDKIVRGFCLFGTFSRFNHLDYIAIKKEFRGNGMGSLVMKMILDVYGNKPITLECEDKLIPFYEKFGFKVIPNLVYTAWNKRLNLMVRISNKTRYDWVGAVLSQFNSCIVNSSYMYDNFILLRLVLSITIYMLTSNRKDLDDLFCTLLFEPDP